MRITRGAIGRMFLGVRTLGFQVFPAVAALGPLWPIVRPLSSVSGQPYRCHSSSLNARNPVFQPYTSAVRTVRIVCSCAIISCPGISALEYLCFQTRCFLNDSYFAPFPVYSAPWPPLLPASGQVSMVWVFSFCTCLSRDRASSGGGAGAHACIPQRCRLQQGYFLRTSVCNIFDYIGNVGSSCSVSRRWLWKAIAVF